MLLFELIFFFRSFDEPIEEESSEDEVAKLDYK